MTQEVPGGFEQWSDAIQFAVTMLRIDQRGARMKEERLAGRLLQEPKKEVIVAWSSVVTTGIEPGYILKVDLRGFADVLDMGSERKRSQRGPKVFGLGNSRIELPLVEMKKAV